MAAIDHAALARCRDHFAQRRDALTRVGENFRDRFDRIRPYDSDHAYPAIESAEQFSFGDASLLRQPSEHRQHRQTRQVDIDPEMFRQDSRDVISEPATGDGVARPAGRGRPPPAESPASA